jgi:hypothetical protein
LEEVELNMMEELNAKYFGFLEQLADEAMRSDTKLPLDASGWYSAKIVRHLDAVTGSYCCWRSELTAASARGLPFNDAEIIARASHSDSTDKGWLSALTKFGRVDDQKLIELIEPFVPRESDRRVFLEIVKRLWSEGQDLLANSG